MELWIRSQDKLLLTKIDYVIVNGLDVFNQNQLIGTYSTYERALEVLDEINEIKYYKYMAELDWVSFANGVLKEKPIEEQKLIMSMMNTYNMPKE